MRKFILAAVFAIVSSTTVASYAPVAFAQAGTCFMVDPSTNKCRTWTSWGSGMTGSTCLMPDHTTGGCKMWSSMRGASGSTCNSVDPLTGACRSWKSGL